MNKPTIFAISAVAIIIVVIIVANISDFFYTRKIVNNINDKGKLIRLSYMKHLQMILIKL